MKVKTNQKDSNAAPGSGKIDKSKNECQSISDNNYYDNIQFVPGPEIDSSNISSGSSEYSKKPPMLDIIKKDSSVNKIEDQLNQACFIGSSSKDMSKFNNILSSKKNNNQPFIKNSNNKIFNGREISQKFSHKFSFELEKSNCDIIPNNDKGNDGPCIDQYGNPVYCNISNVSKESEKNIIVNKVNSNNNKINGGNKNYGNILNNAKYNIDENGGGSMGNKKLYYVKSSENFSSQNNYNTNNNTNNNGVVIDDTHVISDGKCSSCACLIF